MKIKIYLFMITILVSHLLRAQTEFPDLQWKFNESGSHYVKATFLNQTWLRYNRSNPGTMVLGDPADQTFDIGLRRTRIQMYGQLTDHVFFYTQFGQNNFNYLAGQNSTNTGNRKVQVFFHDVLGEYKVWKDNDRLYIGSGLTITNGLSRFSQPGVTSIMTMDVPVFAQATVDQTDEFSRKLSIYARGQLGKIDYRLIVSDPFPITSNGQPQQSLSSATGFAAQGHQKQYQGFFIYNFFEEEPHTTPYMSGTYLGKKKLFNVEAGFIMQHKATWSRESIVSDTVFHDLKLWSVAAYYDAPLNTSKGTALSAYLGYFHYDFGPEYLRYNGIMNPANGLSPGFPSGSQGNAFPMFGTGNAFYTQVGVLLPRSIMRQNTGQFMPYVSLMSAKWNRLTDTMNVIDIGMNWLLQGHHTKITLDYQLRPFYELNSNDLLKQGTRGQWVVQYQIFI